eukprot:gene1083-4901_t
MMFAAAAALSLSAGAPNKPHIVMHLGDDYGWANAGWHRPAGFDEVQTPVMDALVKGGIELDQAYSYQFCSPTRSSLQSGRLPTHVNVENMGTNIWNPKNNVSGFSAIPRNMTGIATHMKDAGMATPDHTPQGRGYDSSLGYFCHCNDYWNENCGAGLVDFSNCVAPGTDAHYTIGPEIEYEEHKFVARVLSVIEQHDPETPLFLNYDSHLVHSPLQVPTKYFDKFAFIEQSETPDWDYHRHIYTSMVNYLDTAVGHIVDALQAKGMWENTLWVFQSDNGGPSFTGDNHTANNYPLKGAKYTNWQGGIRVNAFVAGGYLVKVAPGMVGKKLEGFISIADWYSTFAYIAGVDPTDHRAALANLPPIDSINIWPYLTGQMATSPRTEIFADFTVLLKGKFKVMVGKGTGHVDRPGQNSQCMKQNGTTPGACIVAACWAGPKYPNASVPSPNCSRIEVCLGKGCLYNIFEDPFEENDLGLDPAHATTMDDMLETLTKYQAGFFNPVRTGGDLELAATVGHTKYKGFWGPFLP